MRLVAAEFNGYRRFATGEKLEVDGPITAIVGPNEAGKTSILNGLMRLDDRDAIERPDRTRGITLADSHVVIEALYQVEDYDRAAIAALHGADDPARSRWLIIRKQASGEPVTELRSGLSRDRRPRIGALRELARLERKLPWDPTEHENEEPLGLGGLADARAALESGSETLDAYELQALKDLADALAGLSDERASAAEAALRLAHHEESETHPDSEAQRILYERTPDFLFFDEEERALASDYPLDEVADSPGPALTNLAQLAGLDLRRLRDELLVDETGTARQLLDQANSRLREAFAAWSQDDVEAQFDHIGERVLRIHVSDASGGYSKLDERSDGLKIFVSLLALAARERHGIPPIVLIDELERHLHYDAQADVVQVLARQEFLKQIVYTTHSAGCLPEDLGAGIRLVGPADSAPTRSRIQNRFWTDSGGFSPLLFGMGASMLAFVPVRDAVLSEGATEVVLLPTLLREATGLNALGFQVAPASSEAPAAHVAGLDREASKVIWVVDGDESGLTTRSRLRSAGIPPGRIRAIGGERSSAVLEDLLLPTVYAAALNAELARSGHAATIPLAIVKRDQSTSCGSELVRPEQCSCPEQSQRREPRARLAFPGSSAPIR